MNYKYLFGVFLFACIGLGLLQSCSKVTEEIDPGSFGYDYFPVATGKSWTYMSDSVIIRSSGLRRDTMRSFIREEIGERYKDAEGTRLENTTIAQDNRRELNNSLKEIKTELSEQKKT